MNLTTEIEHLLMCRMPSKTTIGEIKSLRVEIEALLRPMIKDPLQVVKDFVDYNFIREPNNNIDPDKCYKFYKFWCKTVGHQPGSQVLFEAIMREIGIHMSVGGEWMCLKLNSSLQD